MVMHGTRRTSRKLDTFPHPCDTVLPITFARRGLIKTSNARPVAKVGNPAALAGKTGAGAFDLRTMLTDQTTAWRGCYLVNIGAVFYRLDGIGTRPDRPVLYVFARLRVSMPTPARSRYFFVAAAVCVARSACKAVQQTEADCTQWTDL